MAAVYRGPVLAAGRVCRQSDASVQLLPGHSLLHADADRPPERSDLYHPGFFPALVRSYVSGWTAAAAALLPGVFAPPPGKEKGYDLKEKRLSVNTESRFW